MCYFVLLCGMLYCHVLFSAAHAASRVKVLSVLVTLADNMKCDVVFCSVLWCRVLYCFVLSYDRQLMLPANTTSLFCWYPLGTRHKKFAVLCCVVLYAVLLC